MLRFRTAELTYEVDTSGWYQRIIVRFRPDSEPIVVQQQHGIAHMVDSISIEMVDTSDEGVMAVQATIYGRSLNAKGQPDGRQTEGSAWISSIDAASIDKITDAWVTKVVMLPTGALTVDGAIVREVFERRNQQARDEAERVMEARG